MWFRRRHELVDVDVIVMAEAEEAGVGGIFEQPPDEISHAGEQVADGRVKADAMAEIAHEVAFRLGHAVEHLEFERAGLEAEFVGVGEDDGHGAQVVGAERGMDGRVMVEHSADEAFVVRVGLGLLGEDGAGVAVEAGLDDFVIPVGSFDETDSQRCAALVGKGNEAVEIVVGGFEVGLDDDAEVGP